MLLETYLVEGLHFSWRRYCPARWVDLMCWNRRETSMRVSPLTLAHLHPDTSLSGLKEPSQFCISDSLSKCIFQDHWFWFTMKGLRISQRRTDLRGYSDDRFDPTVLPSGHWHHLQVTKRQIHTVQVHSRSFCKLGNLMTLCGKEHLSTSETQWIFQHFLVPPAYYKCKLAFFGFSSP